MADVRQALDPKDYKYILPDAKVSREFSPEKNKEVIEQSIRDYEAMRAKKAMEHDDHYMERADAVITYLRALDSGKAGHSNIEQYFGRKMLAQLRGQQILDTLRSGMLVKNNDGLILKPGGI